jgi:hypothetical protein
METEEGLNYGAAISRNESRGEHEQFHGYHVDPARSPELVAIGAFVWSLLGLWLWLNFDENDGGSGPFFHFMFTFFCGPSAWIVAAWKATHRPPRPRGGPPMKAEQWMQPKNWKN